MQQKGHINVNDDTVSLILCNWNYGRFLYNCLKSVINQSYRPLEIVFIDDGSTDSSIEIFHKTTSVLTDKDIMVKSFFFQNHFGQIRSVNKGISLANGKYCLILDSDDILHKNYINLTKKELEDENKRDHKIGFVYTNCDLVDENNAIIGQAVSNEFDSILLESKNYIPQVGLILTEILKNSLPFDESIKTGTNHHKWKKIVNKGWKGKLLPLSLFKYRVHNNNVSGIGKKVLGKEQVDQKKVLSLSDLWLPQN